MSGFIVAITGGIASGKSAVCRHFSAHGIAIVDADVIAREIVAPGEPALQEITQHFGQQVLLADGHLDRSRLRHLVFDNPSARRTLERITHPAIRQRMQQQCREASSPYVMAAIPLLAEAGRQAYDWVNFVVVVDAPVSVQRQRLIQRDGIEDALAERMIAAQATREQRLALADAVIDNSGHTTALPDQVSDLHRRILARIQAQA